MFPFAPPAIRGLGVSGGFQVQLEDRGGAGLPELGERVRDIVEAARQRPELSQLNTAFRAGVPTIVLS